MKARWDIITEKDGISIAYRNLVDGIFFDCGKCQSNTPISLILDFIEEEGAPGDLVFQDGRRISELSLPQACA